IDGPARFSGGAIEIPGDVSSAAFFIAAAMLLPGSDLVVEGVGLNPTRAAFLNVLRSWGGDIAETDLETERNEPVGTINGRGGVSLKPRAVHQTLAGARIPSLSDE